MADSPFTSAFERTGHRRVGRGGEKTSRADETTWSGRAGTRFAGVLLRVTPRCIAEGENFLTSSNHRLGGSHVGVRGHFLDVVMLGRDDAAIRRDVAVLIGLADARRPRFRRKGEAFRTGSVGAEVEFRDFAEAVGG